VNELGRVEEGGGKMGRGGRKEEKRGGEETLSPCAAGRFTNRGEGKWNPEVGRRKEGGKGRKDGRMLALELWL